ncbi:MAG: hypothetical protein IPK82_00005 [Polyangiaceae bacterium]|nr:hypothetical protein [Polyangiaceae bacterium]
MEAQSVTGFGRFAPAAVLLSRDGCPTSRASLLFEKGKMYPRVHNNLRSLHMGTLVALRLFLSASACSRQHVGMGSFGACTYRASLSVRCGDVFSASRAVFRSA